MTQPTYAKNNLDVRSPTTWCRLCGFPTHGDFYVGVPDEPGVFVHSMSCGPTLTTDRPMGQPTHERLTDGSVHRLSRTP